MFPNGRGAQNTILMLSETDDRREWTKSMWYFDGYPKNLLNFSLRMPIFTSEESGHIENYYVLDRKKITCVCVRALWRDALKCKRETIVYVQLASYHTFLTS